MLDLSKVQEVLLMRAKGLVQAVPIFSKTWNLFKESADIMRDEGGKGILVPSIMEHFFGFSADVPTKTVFPEWKGLTFDWKTIYGRIEINRKEWLKMSKAPNADQLQLKTISDVLTIFEKSFLHNCGRIATSDGSAILAKVKAVGGAGNTKLYLKNYISDDTLYPDDCKRWIYKNLIIDIHAPTSPYTKKKSAVQIISDPKKDETGWYVDVDTALTGVVEDDLIVIYNSLFNEPMGISAIVDDGTIAPVYGGKNRADYPLLKSTIFRGTAESPLTLSRGLLLDLWGEMNKRGATKVTHILTTPKVIIKYCLQTIDILRRVFEQRIPKADLGISGYVWTHPDGYEVPIVVDPQLPEGTLFMIDAEDLKISYNTEFEWIPADDKSKNIFEFLVNSKNQDVMVATGMMMLAIYSPAPNKHGALINIDISLT